MTSPVSPSTRIIKTTARRVEVIASPGSGKTHTLLQRAQHLLAIGVPANQILILSFSNASVGELRQRIAVSAAKEVAGQTKLSKVAAKGNLTTVTVQTAHAFALGLIKKQKVLTEKEEAALLRKTIGLVQKDCRKSDEPPAAKKQCLDQLQELAEPQNIPLVLSLLAVARASRKRVSETVAMGQFSSLAGCVKALRVVRNGYAVIKRKQGVIDYTDMLHLAAKAIDDGVAVPYTHILVDEYQDCSAVQVHLLAQLAEKDGRSIMVFGDPNQAIFGFGGAHYTPLSDVLDGVRELDLPVSRRLTASNAALASTVARHTTGQAIQTRREGELPVLVRDKTQTAQIKHVVQDILKLLADGTPADKIVVLARMKALLQPVEQALLARNVLTNRRGATRNCRYALRALRLVRLVERCEKAKQKVKPAMLRQTLPWLDDVGVARWADGARALNKVARVPSLEGRYRLCAKAYMCLLGGVRKDPALRADVNRWEPICRGHENAAAMHDAIRAIDAKAVATGSIHSVKGGEWDHVFVVGVTDGLLPLYLARDDERALAEERNLLYVAITRARETVRLYHAPANHARSRQQFDKVSRFLAKPAVRKTLLVA